VDILYQYGVKEVHIRIACPPMLYPCCYLNFTVSNSHLELIARRIVKDLEGVDDKDLELYGKPDSAQYKEMVEKIRKQLNITTLKFNTLDNIVNAIGMPKEDLCTHCWDGTSYF